MRMFSYVLFIILNLMLLFYLCYGNSLRRRKMNQAAANAMVEDHCKKFERDCPRDPSWVEKEEKICGFDDVEYELAEFDEMCTLHKVDCQLHRVFRKIEMQVCDARKLFDEQFPEQASDYTKPVYSTSFKSTAPGALWTPLTPYKHIHKNRAIRWSKMDKKVTEVGRNRNTNNKKHKDSNRDKHRTAPRNARTARHLKDSQTRIEVIYNVSKKPKHDGKRHKKLNGNKEISSILPNNEVKHAAHDNKIPAKLVALRETLEKIKKSMAAKAGTKNSESNKTHDPVYYTELEYYTDNETVEYYNDNETKIEKTIKL